MDGGGAEQMDFNLKFHTAEKQLQSGTAWRMEAEREREKSRKKKEESSIYMGREMYPRQQWRGTYNI